jgi:hypothetical protein
MPSGPNDKKPFPVWAIVAVVVGVAVLLLCCFGGLGVTLMTLGLRRQAIETTPVVSWTAEELAQKVKDNPLSVSDYNGKTVQIEGDFDRVNPTIHRFSYITFRNGPRNVRCIPQNESDFKDLKRGDRLVLIGQLRTAGGQIDIANCRIAK